MDMKTIDTTDFDLISGRCRPHLFLIISSFRSGPLTVSAEGVLSQGINEPGAFSLGAYQAGRSVDDGGV